VAFDGMPRAMCSTIRIFVFCLDICHKFVKQLDLRKNSAMQQNIKSIVSICRSHPEFYQLYADLRAIRGTIRVNLGMDENLVDPKIIICPKTELWTVVIYADGAINYFPFNDEKFPELENYKPEWGAEKIMAEIKEFGQNCLIYAR
jgi:hypothetical protein